jgi:hypothetical protein
MVHYVNLVGRPFIRYLSEAFSVNGLRSALVIVGFSGLQMM